MIKKSILISVLSLIVSLLSFLNQILIAKYFGASKVTDSYFAVISFPMLIGSIINIGISYFLVPHFKKIQIKETNFFNSYFIYFFKSINKFIIIIFLLSLFISLFLQFSVFRVNNTIVLATNIVCLIMSFLSIYLSIFYSYLNVNNQFNTPVLLNSIPFIISPIFIVLFHSFLSILSIQLGLLIGTILSILFSLRNILKISQVLLISDTKICEDFRTNFISFVKPFPIVCIAMLNFTCFQIIDAFWAPRLGVSNLSYLNYAQKLVVAIGNLIIVGPSSLLIPLLTEHYEGNEEKKFYDIVIKVIRIIFMFGALFILIFSLLSTELIGLFFERGNFKTTDVSNIASILPTMFVGMTFMISFVVIFRIYFIKNEIFKTALMGLLSSALYFLFCGIGIWLFKIKGIAYSYVLTWMVLLIFMLFTLFHKNKKYFFNYGSLFYCIKVGILVILLFFFEKKIIQYLFNFSQNFRFRIFEVSSIIFLSFALYIFIGFYVFKIKEFDFIFSEFKKFQLKLKKLYEK